MRTPNSPTTMVVATTAAIEIYSRAGTLNTKMRKNRWIGVDRPPCKINTTATVAVAMAVHWYVVVQ